MKYTTAWTLIAVTLLVGITVLGVFGITEMGHNGVDFFETCINAGNEWVRGVCLLP